MEAPRSVDPDAAPGLSRRAVLVAALGLALTPAAHAGSARREYVRAWRQATRKLVVYREFSTALLLRATLLEPPFRDVLADERHRLLGDADTGDAEFRVQMAADGAAYHEVVFAADSAADDGDPRFGNTDARWHLRLEVDGRDVPLVAVERIRKPTPVHQSLYPQLDQWSELWIARFERVAPTPGSVVLRVGSGYGNGEVRW